MSEYLYYEFLAIDQPIDAAAQEELRAISSRARIRSTSLVNSYDRGSLKADPLELLERHFDAFLYLANWGTRHPALRLPRKHFDPKSVGRFGVGDLSDVYASGSHVILDIGRDEVNVEDRDDGSGWLASLALLRAHLMDGDLSLFHLLWLIEVETGAIEGDATVPAPNPGPLSAQLAALAEFLGADSDLLAAAWDWPVCAARGAQPRSGVRGHCRDAGRRQGGLSAPALRGQRSAPQLGPAQAMQRGSRASIEQACGAPANG